MREQAQAIFDAAMKLPVAERSALANQLMLSLDEEPLTESEIEAMDRLWAPEIRRRIAEIESGQVQCIPWEEVDARMRKIFDGQT
jgi:putative addiction module component (TIGR02574 family)